MQFAPANTPEEDQEKLKIGGSHLPHVMYYLNSLLVPIQFTGEFFRSRGQRHFIFFSSDRTLFKYVKLCTFLLPKLWTLKRL